MFDSDNSPGLIVPEEMREILARNPGFIKTEEGGQRIADLYVQGKFEAFPASSVFNPQISKAA